MNVNLRCTAGAVRSRTSVAQHLFGRRHRTSELEENIRRDLHIEERQHLLTRALVHNLNQEWSS